MAGCPVFLPPEAKHYCSSAGYVRGGLQSSFRDYARGSLSDGALLKEGTPAFDEYRVQVLREVDRRLCLGASMFRRGMDMLDRSALGWAHTSLYYASFHLAHAVLGMVGAYVDPPHVLICVNSVSAGSQELLVRRRGGLKLYGSLSGSHAYFWAVYFGSVGILKTWVPVAFSQAVDPVSSDPKWLSDARNVATYDSFAAMELAHEFATRFRPRAFPQSLPSKIGVQYRVTYSFLGLAFRWAREFQVRTDGLSMLGRSSLSRRRTIRHFVFGHYRPQRVGLKHYGATLIR